jgi:nicotinate phosphoribosyltransferase
MSFDPPVSLWPDPNSLGPVTDLYQITMMAGYHASGMADTPSTFELFVRRLPDHRAYLVFAGLEQALGDLMRLRFSEEQVDWLSGLPAFRSVEAGFFDWLAALRFTGDVWSAPEGAIVFPNEPIVRVEAPLAQAQWIETFLIASLNYPTLVASKASRIIESARGRPVYDFGARRGHGPQAGLLAARASYLAGCAGTSCVEAARRLGIPVVGTMAHAWVQAFGDETEAFEAYARVFPESTTLLVDTYDTPEGVRRAAAMEPPPRAVRLDSGDLTDLAFEARAILDEANRRGVEIIASGDLDEFRIAELIARGAPIDAFGVGTEMITSRDAPALSMVYKLVALDGQGRVKRSAGKRTYPLGKQVWRRSDEWGRFEADQVTRFDETGDGVPLLRPVLKAGSLASPLPSLGAIREHSRTERSALPDRLRGVNARPGYPVGYSDALEDEARRLGL